MSPAKVFGIGLSKTGTRSVATAMRLLGFRTLHKYGPPMDAAVARAEQEGRPLLTYIGHDFDAYFDVAALVVRFGALDEQYPGSRFILTTRDLDGFLDSRRRHMIGHCEARGLPLPDLDVERAGWTIEYEQHHAAVFDHFDGRDDLLVIDVIGGDGWDRLAPFLGSRIPRAPFPWENRDGRGTYRPETRLDRARRRAGYAMARGRRRLGLTRPPR